MLFSRPIRWPQIFGAKIWNEYIFLLKCNMATIWTQNLYFSRNQCKEIILLLEESIVWKCTCFFIKIVRNLYNFKKEGFNFILFFSNNIFCFCVGKRSCCGIQNLSKVAFCTDMIKFCKQNCLCKNSSLDCASVTQPLPALYAK